MRALLPQCAGAANSPFLKRTQRLIGSISDSAPTGARQECVPCRCFALLRFDLEAEPEEQLVGSVGTIQRYPGCPRLCAADHPYHWLCAIHPLELCVKHTDQSSHQVMQFRRHNRPAVWILPALRYQPAAPLPPEKCGGVENFRLQRLKCAPPKAYWRSACAECVEELSHRQDESAFLLYRASPGTSRLHHVLGRL